MVSAHLDRETVSMLAEKIIQARRLYGTDSAYVIGLISGIEWLLESIEGGIKLKESIHSRILEGESGKSPRVSSDAGGTGTPPDTLAENAWIKGLVKWFNNDKGYGFISTDSHIDVFVHWRDISSWDRVLTQGDEVEFMVTRTAKGFQAINVMKTGQEMTSPDDDHESLQGEMSAEECREEAAENQSSEDSEDPATLG